MTMTTALVLLAHLAASQAASSDLRIVVVEGEDAVNIIQQKTAVAPVVEVRDRNNLPVAGATVTFTIGSNTASFAGGAQALTVATNAAGQAVAAGISPLTSGAVQIQVAAAFQGQTAVATIVQTNVLTAAQAAGAAGASGASGAGASGGSAGGGSTTAAGGAAGGGGGISGTTIGIVGAAVGGGALVATQAGGGDEPQAQRAPVSRVFNGPFAGQLSWAFPNRDGGPGCVRVHNISGTLRITINSADGAVDGAADLTGSSDVVSVNCSGGPQLGATSRLGMPSTALTGTAQSLAFTYQSSNPFQDTPTSPVGIHTVSFSFTGTLSGDAITGTLTHGERAETTGFPAGTGTASYPVTLRP